METNPLLAHRVVPLRQRVEKTSVALVAYVAVMGGLYRYHGELPERFSREFLIAAAISIVLFAFVIHSTLKHERASNKHRARMIRLRIDDDRVGRHWLSRTGLNLKLGIARLVMLGGIAMLLLALYVLGEQIVFWLNIGVWVPAPVMRFIQPYVGALYTESIWIAGQRALIAALDWLHVGVPLGFLGLLIAGRAAQFMERCSERALAARRSASV